MPLKGKVTKKAASRASAVNANISSTSAGEENFRLMSSTSISECTISASMPILTAPLVRREAPPALPGRQQEFDGSRSMSPDSNTPAISVVAGSL